MSEKITHGRGYVYNLRYYIVWCTCGRKPVLTENLRAKTALQIVDLAKEYKFKIIEMDVQPDHIKLELSCKPQFYISDMIKILKGNIARKLFMLHPALKESLDSKHLWNASYFVAVPSEGVQDEIEQYLTEQRYAIYMNRR